MAKLSERPTVTVAIPTLNEEKHIDACLDSIAGQTYENIAEVLVIDGGSTDATCRLVTSRSGVRVVRNPRRIQAAGLNVALAEAQGEVFVRVDGHSTIEPDYVESCVSALRTTGAAMVGGAMRPRADGWLQQGIAIAMSSPIGAGPARFHTGGRSGWVDTVYLGAFPTAIGRAVGGYWEVPANEDAELAIRLTAYGGIWFDDRIRSSYVPRSSVHSVAKQFYRYGKGRAATVRRHPGSMAPRQVAAPLLVLGLCSPWRRQVATAYGALMVADGLRHVASGAGAALGSAVSLPAMHLSWGIGFLRGLVD